VIIVKAGKNAIFSKMEMYFSKNVNIVANNNKEIL